jgi:TatD DNase family protein
MSEQSARTSLTDIGVNLMSPAFDRDRDAVVARAEAAGVHTLIITGSSMESSAAAVAFATAFAAANDAGPAISNIRMYATAGVHPHNAKDWDAAVQTALRELILESAISTPHVIAAVGECGLDYNRNFSPPDAQRKCFEDQLALAAQLGKPVFLHERDAETSTNAFNDFLAILKQYRPRLPGAVVHCFTGNMVELEAYIALDCYIGITGWICDERRGAHLIPLLPRIPADRLLLETDAPYLLPRNYALQERQPAIKRKSGRNEPCFLPYIAAFAAEAIGKTQDQLVAETSANARRVFSL